MKEADISINNTARGLMAEYNNFSKTFPKMLSLDKYLAAILQVAKIITDME